MEVKFTGHKAHAAAAASAIIPAAVMLANKYGELGMDIAEQALITTAIGGIVTWLITYFVPNKEKRNV